MIACIIATIFKRQLYVEMLHLKNFYVLVWIRPTMPLLQTVTFQNIPLHFHLMKRSRGGPDMNVSHLLSHLSAIYFLSIQPVVLQYSLEV